MIGYLLNCEFEGKLAEVTILIEKRQTRRKALGQGAERSADF